LKVPFIRVVISDHMYSSVKTHVGQESEARWSVGYRRGCRGVRSLAGPQAWSDPLPFHAPRPHCENSSFPGRTYAHKTTIKNWIHGLKFCMHSSGPSCTTCTEHKQRMPTQFPTAATCFTLHASWWHQTAKQQKENEKWGQDLEVWYPHCLAHHLPGAPNTDYLVHPIVSQEPITCNNTRVPLEMRNRKMSKRVCNVDIFAIFVTTPNGYIRYFRYHPKGRVVTTNKQFLKFCTKNNLTCSTTNVHQLKEFMERNLLNLTALFIVMNKQVKKTFNINKWIWFFPVCFYPQKKCSFNLFGRGRCRILQTLGLQYQRNLNITQGPYLWDQTNFGPAQTRSRKGLPLVVNGVSCGSVRRGRGGFSIASDVLKVKGEDLTPPGCLGSVDSRKPRDRNNP